MTDEGAATVERIERQARETERGSHVIYGLIINATLVEVALYH